MSGEISSDVSAGGDSAEDIAQAQANGWQEDFKGENKKSAKEFLHDGKFFKKIDEKNSRIEQLEGAISKLSGHYEKVVATERKKAQVEYQKVIDGLKSEKVAALDEGDNHRVVEIDEQIRTTEKPTVETPDYSEFDGWAADNEWYNKDTFLRVEADKVGEFYHQSGLRGRALFDAIGAHVQQLHPAKFENQKRTKASSVEGGSGGQPPPSPGKAGKVKEAQLTHDEREVYNSFKAMNIFKDDAAEQKYLREVMEIR